MNNKIRFVLILVALLAIVAVAGGTGVWASPAAKAPQAVAANANPAPAAQKNLGTASGTNCGGVKVQDGDTRSVCNVAVVTTDFSGNVFAVASGNQGSGFENGYVSLFFTSGSATICFAAPTAGHIYFKAPNSDTWVVVGTTISNGKACAVVSLDGEYAFGK